MSIDKGKISDPRFALQFLIEANLQSSKGIGEVPGEFIAKHLKKIRQYNIEAEKEIDLSTESLSSNKMFMPKLSNEGHYSLNRKWTHESVVNLLTESRSEDPIEEIKKRAREKVLYALENGWNGPPFSAIELAKILKYDISPNDTILDAHTLPIGKDKFLIEYNPFQKPTRMNFSIAHEIAHTLFSDCSKAIRNREAKPTENRELEQLCNIGASEFQLPYVVFPSDANLIKEITVRSLIELAQKYKSSLESLLMGFVQAIDRPCAVMICTFQSEKELIIDYYKSSSRFKPQIPENFHIPKDSRAYYCFLPGTSESETIQWDFLTEPHDIFCIGISPLRGENKARVAIIIVPNGGRERLQDRKINIEFGDATKPRGKGIKIIAQVVNTSAALGAGFGKSLSKNYPVIKKVLEEWKGNKAAFKLGQSQLVQVNEDTYVFQMLAQNGLFPKNGKIPLEYTSLQKCLAALREEALRLNGEVYMPLIGAGMGRGNWEVIEGLIFSELVNQNVKVNIYLFGSTKPSEFNPKSSLSLFNEASTWQKEK